MAADRGYSVACILIAVVILVHFDMINSDTSGQWNVTCPSPCTCTTQKLPQAADLKSARTVICSRRKLQYPPSALPGDAQALLLRDNGIDALTTDVFTDLQELQVLDLSYNSLKDLGYESVFGNLTALRLLNLKGNHLVVLHRGTFSGLSRLKELVLAVNNIKEIEEKAFIGLGTLTSLDLNKNKLTDIQASWFADLPKLQYLYLDHNDIRTFAGGSFLGLPSLKKLVLSHNNLTQLSLDSFMGLGQLSELDLSYNNLITIPGQAFSKFRQLKSLTLDGNPVTRLGFGSLQHLVVTELSLCNMSQLQTVDRQSLVDLPQLTTLHLNSNSKLVFIDSEALVDLPSLRHVYLHDNALLGVSQDLALSLPSLTDLSLYNNPLQCDCNVFWIKALLTNESVYINGTLATLDSPVDHVTLLKPEALRCGGPPSLKDWSLMNVSLLSLPESCAPSVVPMFHDSYQEELKGEIRYDCRALGVPAPHIHWILSNGKILNNTSNYSRIRVSSSGTLSISHLKAQDAGTYTCVATNSAGYDTATTVLRVHNKYIHILDHGAATNYITVSWNGTGSTIATSDYMILYRRKDVQEEYGVVHLRPYMRKYTISNLQPNTQYEFCIAYQHSTDINKLNCRDIKTKSQLYMMRGIRTVSKLTILLALCLTSLGVIMICVLMVIVRRYQRRKSYHDPSGMSDPGPSGSSISDMSDRARYETRGPDRAKYEARMNVTGKVNRISNIPLDNLYNPPITPLCTSTTSLISTQSNA